MLRAGIKRVDRLIAKPFCQSGSLLYSILGQWNFGAATTITIAAGSGLSMPHEQETSRTSIHRKKAYLSFLR
ncbi:hypothetical protein KTH_19080 [Thermosporothrix hazakensis]|uniref:Uncharacterized protein n=1 Tax=Thermosporothrix sp. COM3 TaxID=2490863 RepID=A0A455SUN1_9CHLR|nr:hypothetical protein KTC_36050 [Thermosporothrix sp. COM3]GCE47039.1 hypothetical protein KTH_19080 [Thermosporothrix hazakensis]